MGPGKFIGEHSGVGIELQTLYQNLYTGIQVPNSLEDFRPISPGIQFIVSHVHGLFEGKIGLIKVFQGQVYLRGLLRSEEHTSALQSRENVVCRLLLEKKT